MKFFGFFGKGIVREKIVLGEDQCPEMTVSNVSQVHSSPAPPDLLSFQNPSKVLSTSLYSRNQFRAATATAAT